MKTIEEMIAIMQAFADGKKIEALKYASDDFGWSEVNPIWNWAEFDYRIKQEPPKSKIVPYESAEGFFAAMKEHGPYIEVFGGYNIPLRVEFYTDETHLSCVTFLLRDKVFIHDLVHYRWQDGHPVGKEGTE